VAVTVIKGVRIAYRLALPIARMKATVLARKCGVWAGDMGNEFHQWNGGTPAGGKRHGDHTAWSADGPPGVVKAGDWHPDDMARFKKWWLAGLRAGRYASRVKFSNLDGRQYGPRGQDQGASDDEHLHLSLQPDAVDADFDVIADYLADMAEEDDMEPTTPVDQVVDVNLPGQTAVSARIKGKSAAWLWWAIYGHVLATEAAQKAAAAAEQTRDAALAALVEKILSATGGTGDLSTAAVIAAVRAETERTRAAILEAAREDLRAVAAALAADPK
jgi:hypothetical protein